MMMTRNMFEARSPLRRKFKKKNIPSRCIFDNNRDSDSECFCLPLIFYSCDVIVWNLVSDAVMDIGPAMEVVFKHAMSTGSKV